MILYWFQINHIIVTPMWQENQESGSCMQNLLTCRRQETSVSLLITTLNTVLELWGWLCSLSLQGQVPHAWGQDGGSGLGSFSCVLGGWCSRLCCCRCCGVEQPQGIFDPVLRLGHKNSTCECLAESGTTYMPSCVPIFKWMKMQMCTVPLQGLEFCRKVIEACGLRGTWATIHPLPTGATWDMRAWEVRYSLSPVLPQEIKIASYLSLTWFFKVRTPRGKTEHLSSSHSAVGCGYPLSVPQLRWPLPSCVLGSEACE